MKWLTNIHKEDMRTPDNATWLSDKVIGRPEPTEKYSVEELENMGLVGVYKL